MKRWPVVGVGLAVVWVFVRGVELAADVVLGEFLIGLAVGLPVAFVFRRFYLPELAVGERLTAVPVVVVYLLSFLWELLTANVDVAYRVLSPSMPIEPEVIELRLRVETDLAVTSIANSITLTPGTLSMDYDAEANALYVHAIDGRDPESVVAPIRTWEDYALRIFDEDADPGDPDPGFDVADHGVEATEAPDAEAAASVAAGEVDGTAGELDATAGDAGAGAGESDTVTGGDGDGG